jgi:hypothetical protein
MNGHSSLSLRLSAGISIKSSLFKYLPNFEIVLLGGCNIIYCHKLLKIAPPNQKSFFFKSS